MPVDVDVVAHVVPARVESRRRGEGVGLELPILALIPGLGNVAWRPASDLRLIAHEEPPDPSISKSVPSSEKWRWRTRLWGAPRIHGELRMLGIDVSERTVSRLVERRPRPPSQTWRTFLTNHLACVASIDFFTVPTLTGRVLFFWSCCRISVGA
jgi:hypothetical protein